MHQRISVWLLTLLAGAVSTASPAANISYSASGSLYNGGGLGPPPFPDGTPISIQFSIDADTPDSSGSNANEGRYSGLTGTFTLGGQTYSIDSYGYREVRVTNDFSYYWGWGDQIQFFISTANYSSLDTPVYNGARIHNLKLSVRPATIDTTIFTSDALSNSIGLALSTFSNAMFNMQTGDLVYINSDAIGRATALSSVSQVPLPAVGWLLGPVLGTLGWVRRKTVP